jgi:hypothetical protein
MEREMKSVVLLLELPFSEFASLLLLSDDDKMIPGAMMCLAMTFQA